MNCAMCGMPDTLSSLVEDHCHITGLVRGYLCRGCNTIEGTSGAPEWDEYRRNPPMRQRHGSKWHPANDELIYVSAFGGSVNSTRSQCREHAARNFEQAHRLFPEWFPAEWVSEMRSEAWSVALRLQAAGMML